MANPRGHTAIASTVVARHGRRWAGSRVRAKRCRQGRLAQIKLSELVEEYLAQHEAEPRTIAKLRWLLAKATCEFGDRCVFELRSEEIGAWRTRLPEGHRFEATQALRQVLNRAVAWNIIDSNPAKIGVDNPRRQHPEKRPFESWTDCASGALPSLASLHRLLSGGVPTARFAATFRSRPWSSRFSPSSERAFGPDRRPG